MWAMDCLLKFAKIKNANLSPHFIIMEIIPFRIEPSKEPDNYSEIYCFLIKGTSKDPYEVEIEIDSFNDLGVTDSRCTCAHYTFRQIECKHIKECKKILKEFNINMDENDNT